MHAPRWSKRWMVSAALLAVAWALGIWFWGKPERGHIFRDIGFWWGPVEILIPTLPAMVVAGLLAASSRTWVHRLGILTWALSTLCGAYMTQFSHFGGICLDPGDSCNVGWDSRLAALASAVFVAAAGAAAERWARRRGSAQVPI